jgi:hypothetical protein
VKTSPKPSAGELVQHEINMLTAVIESQGQRIRQLERLAIRSAVPRRRAA